MKKSGTGMRGRQSALPAPRHLPLVDILVDAQAELQELVVASGLKVLAARRSRGHPSRPLRTRIRSPGTWSNRCASAWPRASMAGV